MILQYHAQPSGIQYITNGDIGDIVLSHRNIVIFRRLRNFAIVAIEGGLLPEQSIDDAFPRLVELAQLCEMGFGLGLVECGADGLVQHKVVAIAEVDGLPFGIARLTGQQAEVEAAENGDDG